MCFDYVFGFRGQSCKANISCFRRLTATRLDLQSFSYFFSWIHSFLSLLASFSWPKVQSIFSFAAANLCLFVKVTAKSSWLCSDSSFCCPMLSLSPSGSETLTKRIDEDAPIKWQNCNATAFWCCDMTFNPKPDSPSNFLHLLFTAWSGPVLHDQPIPGVFLDMSRWHKCWGVCWQWMSNLPLCIPKFRVLFWDRWVLLWVCYFWIDG